MLAPPVPSSPRPRPVPTYLLMRDAKGCTWRDVPMMRRRSTFRKSCEGGVASEGSRGSAGAGLPPPTPHLQLIGEATCPHVGEPGATY